MAHETDRRITEVDKIIQLNAAIRSVDDLRLSAEEISELAGEFITLTKAGLNRVGAPRNMYRLGPEMIGEQRDTHVFSGDLIETWKFHYLSNMTDRRKYKEGYEEAHVSWTTKPRPMRNGKRVERKFPVTNEFASVTINPGEETTIFYSNSAQRFRFNDNSVALSQTGQSALHAINLAGRSTRFK